MDWQCIINPSGCAVSWALGLAQDTVIGQWAESLWQAVGQIMIVIGTLWISFPTPSLTAGYSPVGWINEILGVLTAAVFVGSLMVSGTIMAWRARKESLRDIGEGMVLFVVVTGAGTLVLDLLIQIGDILSNDFLNAASTTPEAFAKNMTGLVFTTPNAATNAAILILVGLLALLANIIQVVLMFARSGLLMLLAGFLPLMAALAVSPAGKTWLKKGVGWSLAFVMYKPVAALIYAVAIKMMSSFSNENNKYHPLLKAAATGDQDGAMGIIMAGALMVASVFALPALIGFLVPSTAALTNGVSSSGLASVGMAASGAVSLTGAARGMSGAKAGVAAASASPPTAAVAAVGAGVSAVRSGVQNAVASAAGSNGTNGSNGASGSSGSNGSAGAHGSSGHNGSNGASGSAGASGANGSNGTHAAIGASIPATAPAPGPAPLPPPAPRAVDVIEAKGFNA